MQRKRPVNDCHRGDVHGATMLQDSGNDTPDQHGPWIGINRSGSRRNQHLA